SRGPFFPGQTLVNLPVLPRGLGQDLSRKLGTGRGPVPVEREQVVPDILLVKRGLCFSGLVTVARPKARRVRGEDLVRQDHRPPPPPALGRAGRCPVEGHRLAPRAPPPVSSP